jgi:hypothetical protein
MAWPRVPSALCLAGPRALNGSLAPPYFRDMERVLWKGPHGLCVWSVDDAARGNDHLYRVTRNGATVTQCRSMRDVFAYLQSQHAVA